MEDDDQSAGDFGVRPGVSLDGAGGRGLGGVDRERVGGGEGRRRPVGSGGRGQGAVRGILRLGRRFGGDLRGISPGRDHACGLGVLPGSADNPPTNVGVSGHVHHVLNEASRPHKTDVIRAACAFRSRRARDRVAHLSDRGESGRGFGRRIACLRSRLPCQESPGHRPARCLGGGGLGSVAGPR